MLASQLANLFSTGIRILSISEFLSNFSSSVNFLVSVCPGVPR